MKYRPEISWKPYEQYGDTERSLKREEKRFSEKIQKKAAPFLKWIYNNYLSETEKSKIFNYYKRNDEYYNFVGEDKETDYNRLIAKLISCGIIDETDAKFYKRKWIIAKLLK